MIFQLLLVVRSCCLSTVRCGLTLFLILIVLKGFTQEVSTSKAYRFSVRLYEPAAPSHASSYSLFVVIQPKTDPSCPDKVHIETLQSHVNGYWLVVELDDELTAEDADHFVYQMEEVLIELKRSYKDIDRRYHYVLGTCSASALSYALYKYAAVPFTTLTLLNPGDIGYTPEVERQKSILVLGEALPIQGEDLDEIQKFNRGKYNWEVDWERYEARKLAYLRDNRGPQRKGNIHLGVNTSFGFLASRPQPDSGLNRDALGVWGFDLGYRLTSRWHLVSQLQFSMKIPNQNSIQQKVQSQMMSSLFSGANTIEINETISGHIGVSADLMMRYFLSERKWRPYISGGIGMVNVQRFEGVIETEIDLSGGISSLMSGGSGLGSLQNTEDFELYNSATRLSTYTAQLGLETQLGRKFIYHASLDVKGFREVEVMTVSLSTGINLLIGTQKRDRLFPRIPK